MRVFATLFQNRFLSFRLVNWMAAIMLAVLAVTLYKAKVEASEAKERIAKLNVELLVHQQAVSILRAEIAHLESSDRLQALSKNYLTLQPLKPKQEVGAADTHMALGLPDVLPVSSPQQALAQQKQVKPYGVAQVRLDPAR